MNYKIELIREWESVEVERRASDAQKRDKNNLKIAHSTIKRYLNPPSDTYYALEYAYHLLRDVTGKTVLDYGCGAGENSVLIAHHGGDVVGVDISPELLEIATQRMNLHGFGNHRINRNDSFKTPKNLGTNRNSFGILSFFRRWITT